MAQGESTVQVPGVDIPRSLSDRPLPVRILVQIGRFYRTKPLGGFGVTLIMVVIIMAVFAPVFARYDPTVALDHPNPAFDEELYRQSLTNPNIRIQYASQPELFQRTARCLSCAPTADHWLGTDRAGRDLYSRIVYGARLSLIIGIGGALIAVVSGTVLGTMSAYFGGWFDFVVQRFVDALFAFPPLILLLLFVQVLENPTKWFIMLALGITGISQAIRVVRSSVLGTREEVYVTAARTIGASDPRIMARHILPNIMAPIIVIFTISIGLYILAEAGLAFLGFGDPTEISWGKMINEGRLLVSRPHQATFTGLALTLTVLGFNLAGDALRDVLDPRLRGARGGRAGF
jgi:peptide/nickel transport system permease protein